MRIQNAMHDGALVDVDVMGDIIVGVAPVGQGAAAGPTIDAQGSRILPGLWDEHVHMTTWAQHRMRVDVGSARTAREAAALVAPARGADHAIGVGMRAGLWSEPTSLALLDEVAGTVPTVIISSDLHSAWINSAAGRRLGMRPGADGLLVEEDAFAALSALETWVDDAGIDASVAGAARAANERGVVGIVDLEMTSAVDAWLRRTPETLRVDAGIYAAGLDDAEARGLRSGAPLAGLARVGPFKAITDGSLGTRTAFCHDAYSGGDDRGMLTIEPDRLRELMARAHGIGLGLAIHAIGDAANANALDAFEQLGIAGRIEHAQLLDLADVARMARLGVTASVQPEHAMEDRDLCAVHWPDSQDRTYLFKSLVDAGVHVVFGSDAPVTPLDPWVAMAAAVTRERDGRAPWHPDERLDLEVALRCSARSTIAVGQPADIVVADVTDDIRSTQVALTMVAGRVVHRA